MYQRESAAGTTGRLSSDQPERGCNGLAQMTPIRPTVARPSEPQRATGSQIKAGSSPIWQVIKVVLRNTLRNP